MDFEDRKKQLLEREENEVNTATSLEIFPGKKGGSKLFFFRGFLYIKDSRVRRNNNLPVIFRCHAGTKFGCQAIIKTRPGNNEVLNPNERFHHICGVPDLSYRRKFLFKQALCEQAKNTLDSLRSIFDTIGGDDGE